MTLLLRRLWVAGLLVVLAAAAWWLFVFATVVGSGYLTWPEAAVCLAAKSSTCELAMSLCIAANRHLFDITRYSPQLFWVGASLLLVQAMFFATAPGARTGARAPDSAQGQ